MPERSLVFRLLWQDRQFNRGADQSSKKVDRFRARIAGVGAVAGGVAVAGLATLGAGALKLAGEFDDAYDTIRVGTGKTGKSLAGLKDDFRAVVKDVPTDFATASTAITELNKRTGQTGKGLQGLAKQELELARITKTDLTKNIQVTTRLFGDWSIKTADQGAALDKLFRASQATGVGVDGLAESVVKFGAPLRQLGFSFDTSIALLAKFEKEGVNSQLVMSGMRIALGKLAKAGKDPERGFLELTAKIRDAGSAAAANKLAIEVFGQRAGPDMAAAIREGRFSLGELYKQIRGGKDTILGAAKDTEDFGEKWQRTLNRLKLLAEPTVTKGLDILSEKMGGLERFLSVNLQPRLGGVRQAWDDNKFAILGVLNPLDQYNTKSQTADQRAETLARSLEELVRGAGEVARKGNDAATGLNAIDAASDSAGHSIHQNLVRPIGEFVAKSALGQGTLRLYRGILRDVKLDLADVGIKLGGAATATGTATTASNRHAAALRAEKQAVDALKSALAGEETAELDLQQAKLNVSTAQSRLTELKKAGKTKSLEYRQAQIDLKRAQIDLKQKTEEYKSAQLKANAATSGAMRATQNASVHSDRYKTRTGALGTAMHLAGDNAVRLGRQIAGIRGTNVTVKVTGMWDPPKGFSTKTLIQMSTPGGRGGFAAGGRINVGTGPTADDVLARVSKGETVVSAADTRRPEFQAWARERRIPGFQAGGMVGNASQGVAAMQGLANRTATAMTRVMARALERATKLAFGGGSPAIKAFIRSVDPLPYRWGAAGPGSYDCSGLVSAVLGKMTGRGGGHGQRYFTTGSIRSGILGIRPGLGGTLQIGVTAGTGHMAGRYGGLGFEAESTRTGIKIGTAASRPESFARHFHLAKGGRIDEEMLERFARFAALSGADIGGDQGRMRVNGKVLDHGGWLMPGQVGVNLTSKPEPVGFDYDRLGAAVAGPVAASVAQALHGATVTLDGQAVGALVVEPQFRDLRRILRSSGRPTR